MLGIIFFLCSLVVVAMTHGSKDGKLCVNDGSIRIEKFWESFMGENCKILI